MARTAQLKSTASGDTWTAGEVRLEPGTTKNKEGRTFPFPSERRTLLEQQQAEYERLKKQGYNVPWVFFRS